ncbi:hypothetical protein O1W69_00160 [Chlamydia sp. 12-01]|uniref:hypothetical protein n=1 Tax=Chlamydia sp. 12-01 TaxID=3002742 RepID=UPI0035D4F969
MSSPSSTPPSCPPPGRNNLYHLQTNPQDPLCIRALRLVAYVLLHIITLGLLLLFHYCKRHIIEETVVPIIPVQPQPSTPPPTGSPVSRRKSPTPQTKPTPVTKAILDIPPTTQQPIIPATGVTDTPTQPAPTPQQPTDVTPPPTQQPTTPTTGVTDTPTQPAPIPQQPTDVTPPPTQQPITPATGVTDTPTQPAPTPQQPTDVTPPPTQQPTTPTTGVTDTPTQPAPIPQQPTDVTPPPTQQPTTPTTGVTDTPTQPAPIPQQPTDVTPSPTQQPITPTTGVTDTPTQPTPPAPTPKPEALSLDQVLKRVQRTGVLPPGVDPKSLEAMALLNEQGLSPIGARGTITAAHILNLLFVATYPRRVRADFQVMIRTLNNTIHTRNAQDEGAIVARLLLKQLTHLDNNYYLVDVPGDGNCFYRSFYVGWICSLIRSGNPQAFENEAQRILGLSFAASSTRNHLLTEQMATILRSCQNYDNLRDVYNNILLSPIHTATAIYFLRNLAFFTMDENRIKSLGGEENVRALILSQMTEAPEMLSSALKKIIQTEPTSPILNHIFCGGDVLPLTTATDQGELALEFLSQLLLNDQDIQQLPQEQRQTASQFQASLDEFMDTATTILVAGDLTAESVNPIIQNFPPEILGHYQKFAQAVAEKRPGVALPTPLILTTFLLSHPSCAENNTACAAFLKQAKTTLRTILGDKQTLVDFLGWHGEKATVLSTQLQTCWTQKQAASLIEVALSLCDGFKSSDTIPQLGVTYGRIAKLMQSTPQTLPEAQLRNTLDSLLTCIYQGNNSASYFEMSASPIFAREVPENSIDKIYAEGVQMFFFLLQYPSLLRHPTTRDAARQIMLIYQPHLQQALRKKINSHRVVSMGGGIFGTFCWDSPIFGNNINSKAIESMLSFLGRDPAALSLCPNMRADFFRVMDSGNPARTSALLNEIRSSYPQLWNTFIYHLDIVGDKATPQNARRPFSQTLTNDVLLYSFVNTHSQTLHDNTELTNKLITYINEKTTNIKTDIVNNFDRWSSLFWLNLDKTITYSNLQNAFLFSLVRRENKHPEAFQSFIHDLNTMDMRKLMRMFNSVNTQAEDEHISAISSALGAFALCQYLADGSLTQNASQLTPLANRYGFLQADYTPEQQARIFVLRANNHYNCLLPKDANDTSKAAHPGTPPNQQP